MVWSKRIKDRLEGELGLVESRWGIKGRLKVESAIAQAKAAGIDPLSIIVAIIGALIGGGSLQKLIDAILALLPKP